MVETGLSHLNTHASFWIVYTSVFSTHTTELAWLWSIEFSKTRRPPHHIFLVGWKISQDKLFVKAQRERAQFIQKLGAIFIQKMILKYIFKRNKIMAQGGCTAVRVYKFLILQIIRH